MRHKATTIKIANVLLALLLVIRTSWVYGLPQVDEVVSGEAEIDYPDANTMQITATDNTIINYSSFDIDVDESVIVVLPSSSSQILNNVGGGTASQLLGLLTSNGIFILVNPAGINIGSAATIDAASLVLSTRAITNTDFLNKDYVFKKLSDEEKDYFMLNEGTIRIQDGGFGVLIAGAIENRGTIIASAGKVALAAGDAIRLDISGGGLISVVIDEETASTIFDHEENPITEQIKNIGNIEAEGGIIILNAKSLPDIFEKAINLDGYVKATKIEEEGGIIKVVADYDVDIKTGMADVDTLELEGGGNTYFYGDKTFNNLKCTVPDKEIYFEAGKTYTFADGLTLIGAPDQGVEEYYIKMRSITPGEQWLLNIQAEDYTLERINISDCNAINPVPLVIPIGVNAGNNTNIAIDPLWDGGGANNLWSTALNWDGNAVPTGAEAVTFDPTQIGGSNKDCTIDNVGTWTGGVFSINFYSGTITLQTDITTGDFTIGEGAPTFNGGANNMTVNGVFSISSGTFNAPSGTLSIGNTVNLTGGVFNHNNGTVTFTNATASYGITTAGAVFNNVIFNPTSNPDYTLNDSFTVNGNLTLLNENDEAALVCRVLGNGDPTITLNGNLILTSEDPPVGIQGLARFGQPGIGQDFTVNLAGATSSLTMNDPQTRLGANLRFTGTGTQNITSDATITIDSPGWTVNKASGTVTQLGLVNLTSGGDLTITQGTFYTNGNDLTVNGTFSNNGVLQIDGDETITLTMDTNSGTVEYVGTGTYTDLAAGDDYFNLTLSGAGSTFNMTAGSTKTINGTLTMTGASGNLVTLRSTVDGTQWRIDPQGDTSVSYVDVKDSNNINATAISATNSLDSGNNTNWLFSAGSDSGSEPPEPPEPPELPGPPGPPPADDEKPEIDIYQGKDLIMLSSYEEGDKYKKRYARGKYKTVVIVYEGKVVAAPYDETGPRYEEGEILIAGQRTTQEGEVE